jgi:beta-glucanase (GH16 family)
MKNHLIIAVIFFYCQQVTPETILQEFNSPSELTAFWDISTWGNDQVQYSSQNVTVKNGMLVLRITASPQGVKPVCGEISSKRNDFLYGSYRASVRTENVPGGVTGWFVYKDEPDLHEIDIEFLTRDLSYCHFTLHHIQTGVDYQKVKIAFDPSAAFHEYRFDWYPDKVAYYIDSSLIATLTKKVG